MHIALIFGAAMLLASMPAAGHGPWPYECCSERDCAEVDARHIREEGEFVHILIPPGAHPMWPADGRAAFVGRMERSRLRKPVTGEWGVCISPTGTLLCVFPPLSGA